MGGSRGSLMEGLRELLPASGATPGYALGYAEHRLKEVPRDESLRREAAAEQPRGARHPRLGWAAVLPPCGQSAVLQPCTDRQPRGRHLGSGVSRMSRTCLTFSRWRQKIADPGKSAALWTESSPAAPPSQRPAPRRRGPGKDAAAERGKGEGAGASSGWGGVCKWRGGVKDVQGCKGARDGREEWPGQGRPGGAGFGGRRRRGRSAPRAGGSGRGRPSGVGTGLHPRVRAGPSPGAGSDGEPENPGGAAAGRRRSRAVALPAFSAAMFGRSGLAPVPSRRLPVCVNFSLASQVRAGEWEKGPRWLPCPRWAESSDLGRMG
ncbi:uncharacterized protein LOC115908872, partial [Camarhynchus parvulus]|uniref:uncharacterized protein LOC115908872 n=1 Tax=Geospiza parvula TaxID=87175 RepID=UPI001237B29A